MAGNTASSSLRDLLAEQLPKDVSFTFYHYSTPPSKSAALFSAPPHGKAERTYCESQFLAASISPKNAPSSAPPEELLVLAIEVLIYTTKHLTTIFVSKADSTGYLSELNLPRSQSSSPLKTICGTFVSWLAKERQRPGKKLVVSLFARAQDQYLFPGSVDNINKHVLDDRGLVKWWCKVLDPIIHQYKPEPEPKSFKEQLVDAQGCDRIGESLTSESSAKGYLVIPGFEAYDTLRYVPSPTPTSPRRWTPAHPLLQIAPYPGAPPRCLVPHFPDDPKSRFLDELDEELPDRGTEGAIKDGGTPSRSNGQWKSVKTLDQFWEFMAFRQECSSGRIVGFIWVVITPPKISIPEEDTEETSQQLSTQSFSGETSQEEKPTIPPPSASKRRKMTRRNNARRKNANTESGPIPLILPRIKSASSNLSTSSNTSTGSLAKLATETSIYYTWPVSSRGTICFSTKTYNRAHEVLIHQSFANRSAAARSTKKWRDEIAVLGGVQTWSWTVIGKKAVSGAVPSTINGAIPITVMGVRKKRKPDAPAEAASTQENLSGNVQVLSEGLVRKKLKTEPSPVSDAGAANGVNTLSAGLVRKKPKN